MSASAPAGQSPSVETIEAGSSRVPVAASPASGGQTLRTLAILSALMAFGPISTDLYLPALPTMAGALKSSPGTMEWTISGYLIGFSLGQLIWARSATGSDGAAPWRRASTIRDRLRGLRALDQRRGHDRLAAAAGGRRLRRRRAGARYGSRSLCGLARRSDAVGADHGDGHRPAGRADRRVGGPAPGGVAGDILAARRYRDRYLHRVVHAAGNPAGGAAASPGPADARRGYFHLLGDRRIVGNAATGACLYFGVFAYVAASPSPTSTITDCRRSPMRSLFGSGILGIMATNLINARFVMRWGFVLLLRVGAGLAALIGLVGRL